MKDYDDEFLSTFNECYPFERYIFAIPQSLGMLFDDMQMTEIFVPYTEIKPITNENGSLLGFTEIPQDEIYIKVIGKSGEMRIGYYDFASHIRGTIREAFMDDFGPYEYECLYVDHENQDDMKPLIDVLQHQKELITNKYGKCSVKKSLRDNYV